jgi:hypothetical protein
VWFYVFAILSSRTPVPGSRAAKENMEAYLTYCRTFGRTPSKKEYLTDSWKNGQPPGLN